MTRSSPFKSGSQLYWVLSGRGDAVALDPEKTAAENVQEVIELQQVQPLAANSL